MFNYFLFFDFLNYSLFFYKECQYIKKIKGISSPFNYSWFVTPFDKEYKTAKKAFRPPVGLNHKKEPIIIFGCSYAYGYVYPDNKILSYNLSEESNRPVYNRAFFSWGIQHMLYQLKRKDFYSEIEEPKYIFYILMSDHLRRLNTSYYNSSSLINSYHLSYKLKDNKLIENMPIFNLYLSPFIGKEIIKYLKLREIYSIKHKNKKDELIAALFLESNKEIQIHYPKAKFIILEFPDKNGASMLSMEVKEKLNNNDIDIINLNELTGVNLSDNEYIFKKNIDSHPNEKAYALIAKRLVEKLKL